MAPVGCGGPPSLTPAGAAVHPVPPVSTPPDPAPPGLGSDSPSPSSPSTGGVQPPVSGHIFGAREYDPGELRDTATRAARKLGPEYISVRSGPGGSRVQYIEGSKVIQLANEVFGFNGWSSTIVKTTTDYFDESSGRYTVGICCVLRVTLKDGAFREDVGYGQAENVKGKGAALEKAKKEAVTDGLKRSLRQFGECLGNCLYDKSFLQQVSKINPQKSSGLQINSLHRAPGFGLAAANAASASSLPQTSPAAHFTTGQQQLQAHGTRHSPPSTESPRTSDSLLQSNLFVRADKQPTLGGQQSTMGFEPNGPANLRASAQVLMSATNPAAVSLGERDPSIALPPQLPSKHVQSVVNGSGMLPSPSNASDPPLQSNERADNLRQPKGSTVGSPSEQYIVCPGPADPIRSTTAFQAAPSNKMKEPPSALTRQSHSPHTQFGHSPHKAPPMHAATTARPLPTGDPPQHDQQPPRHYAQQGRVGKSSSPLRHDMIGPRHREGFSPLKEKGNVTANVPAPYRGPHQKGSFRQSDTAPAAGARLANFPPVAQRGPSWSPGQTKPTDFGGIHHANNTHGGGVIQPVTKRSRPNDDWWN